MPCQPRKSLRWFGPWCLERAPYEAALIYRRAGNLRAVQLLLDRTNIESTAKYLGLEVGEASRGGKLARHPINAPPTGCGRRNSGSLKPTDFPSLSPT
jgi:hypothetical protein